MRQAAGTVTMAAVFDNFLKKQSPYWRYFPVARIQIPEIGPNSPPFHAGLRA